VDIIPVTVVMAGVLLAAMAVTEAEAEAAEGVVEEEEVVVVVVVVVVVEGVVVEHQKR
jgi:hypothetical protein